MYEGLVKEVYVDNAPTFWRFHFLYWPAHGDRAAHKICRLDVSFMCEAVEGFQFQYIPLYALRAMRERRTDVDEISLNTQTLPKYLQIKNVETRVAHQTIGRELKLRFTEDAGSVIEDIEIEYSTGFDQCVVSRSIEYFSSEGIVRRDRRKNQFRVEDGGLRRLRELVSGTSANLFDGNLYFAKCDISELVCKPFAFVIMPFSEKECPQNFYSRQVRDYVRETFGVQLQRADDDKLTRPGMAKIYRYILEAELTIAELTSVNPNVMYELGIAHAVGKETVIFTRDVRKLPFDLRHLTVIEYTMESLLEKWDEALREHFSRQEATDQNT